MSENVGRLIYVEPTEFAEYKIIEEKRNAVKYYPDNISWNQEDLQYTVDLQVVCPDRYNVESCVKRKIESNTYVSGSKDWVSFLNGNTLGNDNYLTDAYTEITFQEINNNKESQKEALGIDSIDISFDSHFFPLVNIKFTDVRAAALFGPTDNEYAQNLRIEVLTAKKDNGGLSEDETKELERLKNKASTSFFKSLFRFPYPRFMLTVMGYYGDKVTFQLAVSDFKTSFNSSNGNFDVNVSFIGYMYGLYTDLPMSLIFTAPYYNEQYWNSRIEEGVFEYNGGGKILKFVEYMHKYYNLHNDMYESNSTELQEYKENNDKRNFLNIILDDYILFEDQFLKGKFKTFTDENKEKYILLYDQKQTVSLTPNLYEKLSEDVKSYNEKFGENLSLGDSLIIYNSKSNVELNKINDNNKIPYDNKEEYKEIIDTVNDIQNKAVSEKKDGIYQTYQYYYFFNKGDFSKNLNNKLDDVNKIIKDEKDNIDEAMSDVIKTKLGFNPSIENIYRMIFAHIETFFDAFEKTEKEITDDINSKKRTKELLGLTEQNSDVPKKSNGDTTIPPFPLCKDADGNIRYPGTFYENSNILNISETNLIERIVSGVKKFSDDFKLAEEKINSLNDNNDIDFTPITVSDIFYDGKNPYLKLKNKLLNTQSSEMAETYIEYFFYSRMMMYIMATNKHDFDKVFEKEFENFKKCGIKINNNTKELLKDNILIYLTKSGKYLYENGSFDKCYFTKNPFIKDDINNKYTDESIFTIIDNYRPGLSAITQNLASSGYTDMSINLRSLQNGNNLSYITSSDGPSRSEIGWASDVKEEDWLFGSISTVYEGQGIDSLEKFHAGLLQIGNEHPVIGSKDKEWVFDLYLGHLEKTKRITGIINVNRENIPFTAFLLLGCLSSYFNLEDYCNVTKNGDKYFNEYETLLTSYYKKEELKQTETYLFKHPKILLLYFGACVYWNKRGFNNITSDTLTLAVLQKFSNWGKYKMDLNYPASEDYKLNTDKNIIDLFFGTTNVFLDRSLSSTYDNYKNGKVTTPSRYLLLSDNACNWLEKYFIEWANAEHGQFSEIDKILSNIEDKKIKETIIEEKTNKKNKKHKGKNTHFLERINNSEQDNLIKKLLSENVYIFKSPEGDRKFEVKDVEEKLLNSIQNSFKNYETIEETNAKEQKDEDRKISDASEQKKALYYTLKRLYDKWLSSYKMQGIQDNPFKLKIPSTDKDNRKNRYTSNADKNSTSEFDSFIFVDSFYRDISDKYVLNPDIFVRLIESYGAKEIMNSNASVFEFMNEIAEKNSLLFASIPVYSNFYDVKTIESIFSPNRKYGVDNSNSRNIPGNTYVIMYTGEASSKLDFGDDAEYEYDGIKDIFGLGHPIIPTELSKLFSKGEGDGIDYTIPVFGVTYGKQNQMYFKNITVNMDEPKVTDYSIANLIQISYGGKNGDSEGYDVGIGQDLYSIYANRSYTCTVEMLGCINIMPMMYFQLNNIPMFRGFYMIISVSHNIVPGNMTTKFTGVRVSKNHIGEVKMVFDYQSLIDKVEIGGSKNYDSSIKISCPEFEDILFTEHFKLSNFISSNTAVREGICNSPDNKEIINRIKEFCEEILEPLYKAWYIETSTGFFLTSGYRNKELNNAVGGATNSAHSIGYGADLLPNNTGKLYVFQKFVYNWLKNSNKNYDQYIDEKNKKGSRWVHIGYINPNWLTDNNNNKKFRKENLYYDGSKKDPYWPITNDDSKYNS